MQGARQGAGEVGVAHRFGCAGVEGAAGVLVLQQVVDQRHLVFQVNPGHPLLAAAQPAAQAQAKRRQQPRQHAALRGQHRRGAQQRHAHTPLARALGLLFPGHAQAAAKVGVAGGAVFGQPLLATVPIPAHGGARKQHARRHALLAYPVHQAARQVHAAAPQQGLARLGPRLL